MRGTMEKWAVGGGQGAVAVQPDFLDRAGGIRVEYDLCPRPLRPIDDGLICHVTRRGNDCQGVFREPQDFRAKN